jgi:hypothetical protein
MFQMDPVLKAYAHNGLRTVQDWNSLGRVIEVGTAARTEAMHQGKPLPLFTKDQTQVKVRAPKVKPPEAAPVAAP